ncbi:MAG TPA: lysophospholipid acyltransferase family protein [Gemmatimonadaceae bacterium]|nr:lysophospholipid acyltransferase family protein [Gemmatimonadaceae bacterium]
MTERLVSIWAWTIIVVVLLVGLPIMVVLFALTAPFDPGRYAAGRFFRLMGVTCVKLNPLWRFRTGGVTVADPRRPYVAVSNHESYADIFLISHLPWEMKWLAKAQLFRIPVMGWIMRMAGDIPVDRASRTSGADALARCRDRLDKRVSVMIFPEGTRSRDSNLLPFKDGAFRLAIEAGVPMLPIAVAGTRYCMAKGSFRFRRANAACRVLDPISTAGLSMDDVPALRERVRTTIDDARRALARELTGGKSEELYADEDG